MTHSVDDNLSPDFERWLEDQRGLVAADLRQFLDVEAGLQEILIGARHAELKTQLRSFLDIEAGLAAIVPAPDPILVPNNDVDKSDLDKVLRSISPVTRLDLRVAFAPLVDNEMALSIADQFDAAAQQLVEIAWKPLDIHVALAVRRRRRALEGALAAAALSLNKLYSVLGQCATTIPDPDSVFSRVGWRLRSEAGDLSDLINDFCDMVGPGSMAEPGEIGIAAHHFHANARRYTPRLRALYRYLNDFIGADLSDAELEGLQLVGVQWSTATIWPTGWREKVEKSSVEIEVGVFQICGDGSRQRDLVH